MKETCGNCVFNGDGLCGNIESPEYLEVVSDSNSCDVHVPEDTATGNLFDSIEDVK